MVKNPLANAVDTGLIPGPGRAHMPRGNSACASQLLKPVCLARETTAVRSLGMVTKNSPCTKVKTCAVKNKQANIFKKKQKKHAGKVVEGRKSSYILVEI